MKKIVSLALAVMMLVSAVPMAYAADVDYTQGTAVTYTATGTEAYTVTVPTELTPGASGTVTLSGTWASDRKVTVTADANVVLTNSINEQDTKTLDVTFAGIEQAGDNTESKTYTETVAVAEMPADALFGTWSGKFNYNVEIGINIPLKFGEKYIVTTSVDNSDGMYYIFYADGSMTMSNGEKDFTLPAGTCTYTATEIILPEYNLTMRTSADGTTATAESDGIIIRWLTLESAIQK